jgi:phospholipid/cholesterol/gamma-HCH transport system ATP-binding protein
MIAERPSIRESGKGVEIRLERIRKAFGDNIVLNDIDLEIRSGEIVAVVGASGSGKTVLLDVTTGLMPPDDGRVLVSDHSQLDTSQRDNGDLARPPLVDLHRLDWRQRDSLRLHWSLVFQRNALFTGTVFDNVALWLREHTGMSDGAIDRRVRESLKAVALDVKGVLHKDRDELSGGMAKRVAIARAIATDPAVIFYDQPTTGLDPVISAQIHDLIFELHHRPRDGAPRTTVIITHDKDLLRRVRPRVVMLHRGRIGFDGPYDSFTESERPEAEEYLREMPVLHTRELPKRTPGVRTPVAR